MTTRRISVTASASPGARDSSFSRSRRTTPEYGSPVSKHLEDWTDPKLSSAAGLLAMGESPNARPVNVVPKFYNLAGNLMPRMLTRTPLLRMHCRDLAVATDSLAAWHPPIDGEMQDLKAMTRLAGFDRANDAFGQRLNRLSEVEIIHRLAGMPGPRSGPKKASEGRQNIPCLTQT